MKLYKLILLLFLTTSFGCDFFYKNNGTFGNSYTRAEAIDNGSETFQYLPDRTRFKLIDGRMLKIDTAWTEESFSYKNGKRKYDTAYGYIFNVPYKAQESGNFTFNFELLDKDNQMFTNGLGSDRCKLRPTVLKDKMQIIIEQKNPKQGVGWKSPIITDTISFVRIN